MTAARAFADRGYHETTIESIAAALRVSKPTVYYCVRNKEEILFEIARAALEDLDRSLVEPAAGDLSPAARLHRFFGAYAKMITSDFGICMALVADRILRPQSRRKLRACKKQIEARAAALLEECLDGPRPGAPELRLLTYALFGAFDWIPQWFAAAGEVPLDAVARYYVQALALPFVAQKS